MTVEDPTLLAGVNAPDQVRAQLGRARRDPGPRGLPPAPYDLVVRAARVVTPAGTVAAEVGVRDGRIAAVAAAGSRLRGTAETDLAADEVLLPGLVDAHVHVNDPGRTEWEGFASATRAAAAGGVTTIVDMPLNSVPSTVTVEALELKRTVAWAQAHVDVGFWGGAVPGNRDQLPKLDRAGVFGFKCFTLPSGVDEFPPLDRRQLREHLAQVASFGGLMIVHAEDAGCIADAAPPRGGVYADFLASRPDEAEELAVADLVDALRTTGARGHLLHVSSARVLPLVSAARRDGVDLTAETCPHYLTLTAEDVPDGSTAFKCCPPIRGRDNRDQLWAGLLDGTIAYVASDHSPATPELKDVDGGDFGRAWGGIAGVQVQLSVVWTEARRRGIPLDRVVGWMSTAPAARLSLASKGAVEVGRDADLVVFAPDERWTVDPGRLLHRHPVSPYAGRSLHGVVRRTYLRGEQVRGQDPRGRLLVPSPSPPRAEG